MRALLFVTLAACGSQQTPTQTQAPAPTQTSAPSASQSHAVTPTPAPTTCKTNDDCAMSITRSCCAPCGSAPFADLKSEVDAINHRCAEVECATRVPQECKPTESIDAYHAECRNDSCVAVRNPPPVRTPTAPATLTSSSSCSRDGDCVVSSFRSCCTSCQASAYATSKRELEPRQHRCAIVDCAINDREQCEPVVDAALYRAVCRAGTCAGVKR